MAVCVVFVGLLKVPLTTTAFVPVVPPVTAPVTDGADQLYNVPDGITPFVPFIGVTVNDTPLQVMPVIAVTDAEGLTVTVTVNAVPVQFPDDGVTIYVAVCAVLVGFVRVPLITLAFVALNPPVNPPVTLGALQLYVVPAGTIPFAPLVGVAVKSTPLQVTLVIAVTDATGLIVTATVNAAPVPQLTVVGVTR